MSNKSEASTGGIGFCGLLAIVFITLKLAGIGAVATWSGMFKVLQLLTRSDVNEYSGIRQVVPSFQALEIIAETGKI